MSNKVLRATVCSLVLCQQLMGCGVSKENEHEVVSYRLFQGAWFEVEYPAEFVVEPSMSSNTGDGFDSSFFRSPDDRVSFYVCSPQWGREAADIRLNPAAEKIISRESLDGSDCHVEMYTIGARDGSYFRSYEETTQHDGSVRWVVGVRYVNETAYQKYEDAFRHFKKSLKRFTD